MAEFLNAEPDGDGLYMRLDEGRITIVVSSDWQLGSFSATPACAREIAAELVRLADEMESQ